jgi:hypothetical protein
MTLETRSFIVFIQLNILHYLLQKGFRCEEIMSILSLLDTRMKSRITLTHVRILKTNTKKHSLEPFLSQILKCEILAKFFSVMNLNSELLDHLHFPKSLINGCSVLRNLL